MHPFNVEWMPAAAQMHKTLAIGRNFQQKSYRKINQNFQFQPAIIPVVGPRAFEHPTNSDSDKNNITTACELFISPAKKIACFQLRSPLAPQLLTPFFDKLTDFLLAQQVAELIVLTSSFAHEQHAIEAAKFVHLSSDRFRVRHQKILASTDRWTELEKRDGQIIHGGGFALKLWQHIEQNHQIPVAILFKYVSEGDNRHDAVQVLDRLDHLLDGQILGSGGVAPSVKVPVSWKALFGNDPTEQLY